MAKTQLTILFFSLLLAFAFVSTSAYKNINIVVEGMVYCQSCIYNGTHSLTDAKPIPASEVSVTCKDHENKTSFYNVFESDTGGYFYAQLEGFKMSHYFLDHPLHSCKVKLVSSPLTDCNVATNVNYGLDGAALRYENKKLWGKNYAAIIYAAGPLAFRPAHCSNVIKT
ncbi:hypothetical protein LguiB_029376 [Lonicera macranthoides]